MEWHSPFNLPCLKTLSIDVFFSPSLINAFKLIRGWPILETSSLKLSFISNIIVSSQRDDYIFNIPTLKHLKLEAIGKCVTTSNKTHLVSFYGKLKCQNQIICDCQNTFMGVRNKDLSML